MTDAQYMQKAIELAQKGIGFTNPNPMVGALIVKNGKIIGQGCHEKYGGDHAEINALASAAESPEQATMYVTMEPCSHWGQTPPCADAVIKSGIKRVVIGTTDPNPLVAGKGIERLESYGIAVIKGVLEKECSKLNEVFFHFIKAKTPYVVMKYAMTMDGKIATVSGQSKWISGDASRMKVQKDRHRYMAVMTGIGTVLNDDPQLTCRIPGMKQPIRIICDSSLRTPLCSNIVNTANQFSTLIATCCKDADKQKPYLDAGCQLLVLSEKDGHLDLNELMQQLGKQNIDSVLLEGGAELNWSALNSGIVNKIQTYLAPKIFGGQDAKSPISGFGVESPDKAYRLSPPSISCLDGDLLLECEVLPESEAQPENESPFESEAEICLPES